MPAALLSVAALATTGLIAAAVPAGAAVTAGPGGNDANGIPTVMRDAQGVAVQLCLNQARCAEPVDPADPAPEEPEFPEAGSEAAYFSAEATVGPFLAIYGIEAVSDDAGVVSVLNVARFRARDVTPGATYVIKGPWGTVRATANAQGRVERLIETGGEAGSVASGHVTTFLRRTNAPAGFLGDFAAAPGTVVGSPTGFNRVTVTGPGVKAATNRFTVAGQMAAGTAMTSMPTKALRLGSVTKARPSVATIPVSSFGTAAADITVTKSGANPGAFQVQTPAAVASGSAANIRVSYAPTANRNVSAILTIDDNGLAAPRQVKLTGIANDTRAPKVLSSNPARGAANVAAGKSVKVQFSEAVRSAGSGLSLADASGDKVRANVARVGKTNTYVLNPGRALARGARYTVKVNGGAKALRDLAGNPARDTQWSFRTR